MGEEMKEIYIPFKTKGQAWKWSQKHKAFGVIGFVKEPVYDSSGKSCHYVLKICYKQKTNQIEVKE